jgi:hypothetical protein
MGHSPTAIAAWGLLQHLVKSEHAGVPEHRGEIAPLLLRSSAIFRDVRLPARLRFHRASPERLFHPLGDLPQIGIARLAPGPARV